MIEFQAVLLAGGSGSRMYPLTESTAKHFLPIANRPMISFQLEMLEKARVFDVIIITTQQAIVQLQAYVDEYLKSSQLKVQIVATQENIGTAGALLNAKEMIKSDFIVVSGDLIADSDFIHTMTDMHRTTDAAATLLLKRNSKMEEYLDFIGLEDVKGQKNVKKLTFFRPDRASAANDEQSEDVLKLQRSVLVAHPHITVYNKLVDSHFYIFSHWVLDIIESLPEPKSIKGSLIPKLVEIQNAGVYEGLPKAARMDTQALANSMSIQLQETNRKLSCFVLMLDDNIYCGRANTAKSYMQINSDVAKGATKYAPLEAKTASQAFISTQATVSATASIGAQCIVGDDTTIGDKCVVKHSVIGKNCTIGNAVRITNSLILDNVTIEDACIVDNSTVCPSAVLKTKSRVEKGSTIKTQVESGTCVSAIVV